MFKSCRSRKTKQNEYLVVKIGVDTAENGPSEEDGPFSGVPSVKLPVRALMSRLDLVREIVLAVGPPASACPGL